jgi:hypothetical protein
VTDRIPEQKNVENDEEGFIVEKKAAVSSINRKSWKERPGGTPILLRSERE